VVVCTVTKEGVIDNKGYRDYWDWQALKQSELIPIKIEEDL
jgi:hypothetical protein